MPPSVLREPAMCRFRAITVHSVDHLVLDMMHRRNTESILNGRLVATNKNWDEKCVRIAYHLGLIDTVEYEVLNIIKTAMPVQEILKHASPADLDVFPNAISRLAAHEVITLEQPERDETIVLEKTVIEWERASFYC